MTTGVKSYAFDANHGSYLTLTAGNITATVYKVSGPIPPFMTLASFLGQQDTIKLDPDDYDSISGSAHGATVVIRGTIVTPTQWKPAYA